MAEQVIIVMSDSHGDRQIVEEIKNHYKGKVDAIFHNGDSELESTDPVWEGIHVVKGNMDFYGEYPERLVTQLGPTRIIQTHGHLFQINFSFQNLFPLGRTLIDGSPTDANRACPCYQINTSQSSNLSTLLKEHPECARPVSVLLSLHVKPENRVQYQRFSTEEFH